MLISHPVRFTRLRETRLGEERYVRPARSYDIPSREKQMIYRASSEKYLRPTLYCNPAEPEVVALANELGAYEKPDWEFAQAAFEFTKNHMTLEICPFDGVGLTLRRGTGTCFHLISVFIALCRAAGIRARYKMFAMNMVQSWREVLVDVDPLLKQWYDSMGYFMIEGEGEAYVNGTWTVAHVGARAERQAAAGLPITQFGEDSIGVWFEAVPGTLIRSESIPLGLGSASKTLQWLAPGSMERINVSIQKQVALGARIIDEAGGREAYDKAIRAKWLSKPTVELNNEKAIVFEG